LFFLFLNQELISYRYSCCCCCCCCCCDDAYQNSLRLRHCSNRIVRWKIWQRRACSSSKYASIDGVRFLSYFQMANT